METRLNFGHQRFNRHPYRPGRIWVDRMITGTGYVVPGERKERGLQKPPENGVQYVTNLDFSLHVQEHFPFLIIQPIIVFIYLFRKDYTSFSNC